MVDEYRQIFFTQTLSPEKRLSHPIFEWRQYHYKIFKSLCNICDYVRMTAELHSDRNHIHFHAFLRVHKSQFVRFYRKKLWMEREYGWNKALVVEDYHDVQSYITKYSPMMSEYLGAPLPLLFEGYEDNI